MTTEIINEPIENHDIMITELVIPDNKEDAIYVMATVRLKTIAELREYLYTPSKYAIAKSLGYRIKTKPSTTEYNPKLVGRIAFKYSDRIIKNRKYEFLSINHFVHFIRRSLALTRTVKLPT